MKKKEIWIIVVIFVVCLAIFFISNLLKENVETEDIVLVKLRDEVIFTFDVNVDGDYEVEGLISPVYIEVREGSYRVHDVGCPDHLCEKQGWIKKGDPTPITCLPNQIVIEQEIIN